MSRHRLSVVLDVDDDALAAHDSHNKPPPPKVEDWTEFSDIADAIKHGIVDPYESTVEYYDERVE